MVEKPEGLEELHVAPHAIYQVVPSGRQCVGQPIGFSSPVEKLPVRYSSRCVHLGQIQDVSLMVQDYVRAPGVVSIYLVHTVTRIKADVGSCTGCQEGYSQRPAQSLFIIEDLKFIHMSVAKELSSQGVLIPGYNSVIIPAPALQTVPWGNVANYMHFVSSILSSLELPTSHWSCPAGSVELIKSQKFSREQKFILREMRRRPGYGERA